MTDRNEIERLRNEATELRVSMDLAKQELAQARHQEQQRRLETRDLPPLSQMTRLQKRYFLEPWWTVGWVGSWLLSIPAFIAALFTPLHTEFGLLGLLLVFVGAAFGAAKLWLAEWNQQTESHIASPPPRRSDW